MPTPAIRNLIREGKTHQIYSALQTGAAHGMQTMDSSLAELVRNERITRDLAMSRANNEAELARLISGAGATGRQRTFAGDEPMSSETFNYRAVNSLGGTITGKIEGGSRGRRRSPSCTAAG